MKRQLDVILQAIAAAQAHAIATGTYKMPNQKTFCLSLGLNNSYLRSGTQPAIAAQTAFNEAKQALEALKLAGQPAPAKPPQPSKRDCLLAQLDHQPRYLVSLPMLLGVDKKQIDAIVQPLIDLGVCEIKQDPFDKTGKDAKLHLKQRQQTWRRSA